MEELFLAIIFLIALFYLYRKLFKTSGCSCGTKNCSASSPQTKASDDDSQL